MSEYITVGELKQALAELPDDMPLIRCARGGCGIHEPIQIMQRLEDADVTVKYPNARVLKEAFLIW